MIRRRKGAAGVRYQWRVTLKGFPPEYGTCPTKDCAVSCSRAAEQRIREGRTRQHLTFAEIADLYEADYLPKIPDSAPHYRLHLKFWRKQLGKYSAGAIDARVIAKAREAAADLPGRAAETLTPATVNRYMQTLSSVFHWASLPAQRLVDRNPVRTVGKLREPSGRKRWLSRPTDEANSELERLLAACKASESPILYDLVALLLATGCRQNEILGLRRASIRLSEGGFTLAPEQTKTEQSRFVALEGIALEVVRRRLKVPVFGSPFLFPSSTRGRHASFPTLAWKRALRNAGIANFRPHDLRHTHGSYLAMMGKTLPEIMAALGHTTPTVALRYIHLADESKRDVSREVNAQISSWLHPET